MSSQVLARKWRPGRFQDLVGQEHVVRALVNGLERGQLHHAYLLTGTRGVGKTTLARILAKALNCEQGRGADPCGVCSTCREIEEGRYVDLIEVDAASRTKVEQTRELLDNVPFAPVRGRVKVYLIDEVHMFSSSSFNALLKTLEEPPDHVKFVLATTDPQRLPATILSRCLQFNLKRLLPEQISGRIEHVLQTESVPFDEAAIRLLAEAADGSMRDALSLLDQAIAFGAGEVRDAETRAMLGTRSADLGLDLLDALADRDGAALLARIERAAELSLDFAGLLKDLLRLLHRIALAQQLPASLTEDQSDFARLQALAQRMAPEDVQLDYQVLLTGQTDLPLAPDARVGLEMVLLRALAFQPDSGTAPQAAPATSAARTPELEDAKPKAPLGQSSGHPASAGDQTADTPESAVSAIPELVSAQGHRPPRTTAAHIKLENNQDWHQLLQQIELGGLARQLASHCAFSSWDGCELRLLLAPEKANLHSSGAEQRIAKALMAQLGSDFRVRIEQSTASQQTPADLDARIQADHQVDAERRLDEDSVARELRRRFEADWIPNSMRPLH